MSIGLTHNWDIFADVFAEDATYWEHLGKRHGREAILIYAGDKLWSYQEDIDNVDEFATMIAGWEARVRELGGEPGGSVEAVRAGF